MDFFVQEEKGRKGVGLRIICPSKTEEKSKVRGKASQKRSKESRPQSRKASSDQVRFPDRLQNNSMLPFHATNRKKVCNSHGLAAGANKKKLVLEFLVKIIYATPLVYLFLQLFYFYHPTSAPQQVSFN